VLLGLVGAAHGAEQHWTRLADLLRQARLVAAGTAARTESYDDCRLSVAIVAPDRVLKGEAMGDLAVVEEHDLPSSPTLLPAGEHVLIFLTRAPRTSSLARALPERPTYWTPLGGRMGVLASPSAEAIREAADLVAAWVALATDTTSDAAARAARLRTLAFDEVAAAHPVVVEDGAAAIAGLPDLRATLSEAEQHRLRAALERADLPPRVRVALIRAVAAAELTALVPVLRSLRVAPPEVLAAGWQALRTLGAPPTPAELAPPLRSRTPAVRAVAAPAVLVAGGAAAVPQLEHVALTDGDPLVGKAAATALGTTKVPGGLAALERIYIKTSSDDVRQAAGNAIVAWGGDEAADALARLAFDAPPGAQKWAVTLLFALGRKQDDPRLVRIATTHPDATVRDLVEHGFDLGTHHH
jgi:hypothetical protein